MAAIWPQRNSQERARAREASSFILADGERGFEEADMAGRVQCWALSKVSCCPRWPDFGPCPQWDGAKAHPWGPPRQAGRSLLAGRLDDNLAG